MTIKLGYTDDPLNKLEKTVTWPDGMALTGNLKADCDILDPVVEIETSINLSSYNYAQIEIFGRYYFIRQIINCGATLWRLVMHVDVLYSYAAALRACQCIAANSASRFNMYLPDSNYKSYQDDKILINRFPFGFDRTHARFVLTAFCDVSSAGPITRENIPPASDASTM